MKIFGIFKKSPPIEATSSQDQQGSNLGSDAVKVSIHINPGPSTSRSDLENSKPLQKVVADKRRANKYDIWHKVDSKGVDQYVLKPKQPPVYVPSTDQSEDSDTEHILKLRNKYRKQLECPRKPRHYSAVLQPDEIRYGKSEKTPERYWVIPDKSITAKKTTPEKPTNQISGNSQYNPGEPECICCPSTSVKKSTSSKKPKLNIGKRVGNYVYFPASSESELNFESDNSVNDSDVEFSAVCLGLKNPTPTPLPSRPKQKKSRKSKKARRANRKN